MPKSPVNSPLQNTVAVRIIVYIYFYLKQFVTYYCRYLTGKYDIEACQNMPLAAKNKVNLNFTLDLDDR